MSLHVFIIFFFQAEDGIRDIGVTGVQTCALPIVDLNPGRLDEARRSGWPAIFGDAATEPVLAAAVVGKARLVIVTLPDPVGARLVVQRVRATNPDVHVVARSASAEQLEELARLGVYEAVQPEFEAGVELGGQALSHLGGGAGEEIGRASCGGK